MSDVVQQARELLAGITPGEWGARDGFIYPLSIRYGLGSIRDQDAEFIAAAPRLVAELADKVERLQEACKTLGGLIVHTQQMALDATGLHHLIGEDGDGDWAAVWENLAELPSLRAEVERLRERIGRCICDCNPATSDGPEEECPQHGREYSFWVEGVYTVSGERNRLRDIVNLVTSFAKTAAMGAHVHHDTVNERQWLDLLALIERAEANHG